MKNLNCFVALMVLACSGLFAGCGEKIPVGDLEGTKMYCDFPNEITLTEKDGEVLNIDAMGIMDFKFKDSLLMVSTQDKNALWKLYNIPMLDSIAGILTLGSGPLELTYPMPINQTSYDSKAVEGKSIVEIPQFDKKQLISIDLKASLDSAKLVGETKDMPQVPVFPVLYYSLPDGYSYMISIDPEKLTINRQLFKYNEPKDLKILSLLNSKKVVSMEDISVLTSFPIFQPGGTKIAEFQGNRGIINIFDYNSDQGFSLVNCGVEPDLESSLERRDRGVTLYGGANAYKDFFVIIANEYDNDQLIGQSLLLFNWDGDPISKINLPIKSVGCFDIDFSTSTLYLLNIEEDNIVRYDISGVGI